MRKIIALLPFILILVCILFFYLFDGYHYLNFHTIQQEHLKWQMYVEEHPLLAGVYFIGIYIVSVLLVIPDSTVLTLLAGFLFPIPLAIIYVCFAETLGGTLFFLAARMAFMETLGDKHKSRLSGMRKKFHAEEIYYLLFLRFSHLIPFWLINLAAGLFHVKTRTFIWTTVVGVLPLTYFLVLGGSSLSTYFETHTTFNLREIFTTQLKISLILLGLFALLPIFFKKLWSHKG